MNYRYQVGTRVRVAYEGVIVDATPALARVGKWVAVETASGFTHWLVPEDDSVTVTPAAPDVNPGDVFEVAGELFAARENQAYGNSPTTSLYPVTRPGCWSPAGFFARHPDAVKVFDATA